ncbi:MAG: RNA-binding domain-containing protein [Thermoproteota archaeon]|nr:RNA-binding domain-containing protein [Thermoproteota archaeon]
MQLEVKINLILHATENERKILEVLQNVFDMEQEDFQIEQVPGHFNNPILLISSKLKKKCAQSFIKLFFSKMEKEDFQEVFENIEDYVTSSGLSLRISKQKLVSEILRISKEDAIKINISTPVYVKSETKKIYQELMKM